MDLLKNHLYLIGYLQGQYSQIRHLQARLPIIRALYPEDQEMQLELDRMQEKLDERLDHTTNRLFEIPRSN